MFLTLGKNNKITYLGIEPIKSVHAKEINPS